MKQRHRITTTIEWVQVAWPVTLTSAVGAIWFLEPITASIRSTPHPGLVYLIFGALLVAVVAIFVVLAQLHREEHFAQRLSGDLLPPLPHGSPFREAYELLAQQAVGAATTEQRRELERRLQAGEDTFTERLSLPGFIAGGLVGLGLVGTFIGLLGALNELAQLFSGMTTGAGVDPTVMFSGLLEKLQAPMTSMGTAFIASLYGLLGSLLVGLMLVAVNKARHRALNAIQDRLLMAMDRMLASQTHPVRLPNESDAEHRRWLTLFTALEVMKEDQQRLEQRHEPMQRIEHLLEQVVRGQEKAAAPRTNPNTQLWLDAWDQTNEHLARLRSQEEMTARSVLPALQAQEQALHRLTELALQSYELVLANTERRHHSEVALQQSFQNCQFVFEQATARLRSLLALQVGQQHTDPSID